MLPCDRSPVPEFESDLALGRYGERVAARFLRRHGYRVLHRNYNAFAEEVDLVCREGKVLAFVEVKSRRDEKIARPAAAVDKRKQQRLTRAARQYLKLLSRPDVFCRFDVVEVILESGKRPRCRLIRDAHPVMSGGPGGS